MVRSNAGKARISIIWLVMTGILFLGAATMAFVTQSDLETEKGRVVAAETAKTEKIAETQKATEQRRAISMILGWYADAADAASDPEAARKALEDLKGTFPDIGAAEKDYQHALEKIVAAYDERGRKNAELETRIKGLESELTAAKAATDQVTADKDKTIAELRGQISDEQKNAQDRIQELEGTLEQVRGQVAERDGEVRKTREDATAERRKSEAQKAIDDARIAQLSADTKFARDPHSTAPDGSILEVSDRLGTGWINIGANQRVVRGIVFEVRSSRPGDSAIKALAEVTAVKNNSAEVLFSNVVDRFSPPAAGDLISNRLYDPSGGRNAVLVGRFSGTFNEQDLKALLVKMGITVQNKVDKTTHFLIVGSEMWNDPATGEPLTDPMQPSDLPEYKQGESLGVQIVPLQDIRDFFRMGAGQ